MIMGFFPLYSMVECEWNGCEGGMWNEENGSIKGCMEGAFSSFYCREMNENDKEWIKSEMGLVLNTTKCFLHLTVSQRSPVG